MLLFCVLTTQVSPVSAADQNPMFIPFESFLQMTKEAELEQFAKRNGFKVLDREQFERMKAHILTLYQGVEVKNSFSLDDIGYVDCVAISTQPALNMGGKRQAVQKPPPALDLEVDENTAQAKPIPNMLVPGKYDAHGNAMFCDDGYIPMRRVTLDEMVRFPTLEDFFNKYGVKGTKGDPTVDKANRR